MPEPAADRAPLTRPRVLAAAVSIADAQGLAALSMRKVAAELGFEVMSLYNHVANKDDMLEGMIDVVVSEVEYGSGDWRAAMRATVISAHDCLTRHPWAAGIWNSHWPGPVRFGHMEWILTTLTEAGFSDEIVYHAFHAIELHIVGFAMQAQQFAEADLSNGGDEGTIERFFERVPESDFPNLVHHVREHLRDDHVDEFEFILDLTLDGLERLRDR